MFKKKEISETAIMGMVYQIRYLIDEKNVSDEALGHHLGKMLSDLGIRVDYVPSPRPWEMTRRNKKATAVGPDTPKRDIEA